MTIILGVYKGELKCKDMMNGMKKGAVLSA